MAQLQNMKNNIYLVETNGVKANEKARLLIKALLQMTMDTDEATDRHNAPITPNWTPLIFSISDRTAHL